VTAVSDPLLLALKTEGPQTTKDLADALGISRQAVRQQVDRALAEGLVAHVAEKGAIGRPRFVWSLTSAGHAAFPDGHAEALVGMIAAVRAALGEAALDRVISHRESEATATYRSALAGADSLAAKAAKLAELRTAEGYMAQLFEEDGGVFILAENHCPICAAATACQGFCRSELSMFQDLLAPEADVERTEHLLQGARRCAYLIRPRGA
jgi:predicted ArsR family transcriptional regulator